MVKKEKSQSPLEKALDSIQRSQLNEIRTLRENATMLKDCADRLLKKIEEEGIKGRYSINSDVLRYSKSVWRSSYRLGDLKRIEKIIKGER